MDIYDKVSLGEIEERWIKNCSSLPSKNYDTSENKVILIRLENYFENVFQQIIANITLVYFNHFFETLRIHFRSQFVI